MEIWMNEKILGEGNLALAGREWWKFFKTYTTVHCDAPFVRRNTVSPVSKACNLSVLQKKIKVHGSTVLRQFLRFMQKLSSSENKDVF